MNKYSFILLISCILYNACSFAQEKKHSILVFSKTEGGYRHASIAAGKTMFLQLGRQHNIIVDTTEDAAYFTREKLQQYSAIVFLSSRGNVLDSAQQEALKYYIHQGGGYAGIHAATTTEYEWPWYNQLAGAYFDGHPKPQEAVYHTINKDFPATHHLPDTFRRFDEIYNFRSIQDSLIYLITVDETSYTGGKMGAFHPISWYRNFEGGRSFYLGLGHFDSDYSDPFFISIVWKGLQWAMGISTKP